MRFLFEWSSSRPYAALALAAVLSAGLAVGALFLRVDGSMEHLLSEHDPRVVHLREVMENFGERPLLLLMVEAPDPLAPGTVELLRALDQDLASIPGVEASASLFTMPLAGISGGPMQIEPALSEASVAREGSESLRKKLLERSLTRDHFISADGKALASFLFLEPEKGPNHQRLLEKVETLKSDYEARLPPGSSLTLLGAPLVKVKAQEHIRWDLAVLAPISMLVVGGVIYLFYRSITAMLLPLVTGSLSAAATLGFMGFAGYEISIFLSSIVVLILVLGCTEDLHILSEYHENLDDGMEKRRAITEIGSSAGKALLMTSGSTVLSFATLAITPVTGLRDFSISCAVGMTLNFFLTILIAPALLALLPLPKRYEGRVIPWIERSLVAVFLRRRGAAVLTLAVALAVVGTGIAKLTTDTNYLRFFSESSPVNESYRRFGDRFGGASIVTVTYETHRRGGVYEAEMLAGLLKLNGFLASEGGKTIGLCEFLEDFQRVNGRPLRGPEVPLSPQDLALFREAAPMMPLSSFLDFDKSRAAIRFRSHAATSKSIVELEKRILAFAEKELPANVEVKLTGDRVIVAHLCETVSSMLTTDLLLLGATVALIIGLATRSWRQGLILLIPNLYPIALTFGAMGWLGIPLGTGTFPVAIVAFGIAVDDTIHFIFRFNEELKSGYTPSDAVTRTISRELRPVLAASITVAAGYLVMMLSPFRINREIGVLFSATMIGALVADLILTPVLLKAFLPSKPALK
jgi:uncharacterized protein